MKKIIFAMLLAIVAVTTISAQTQYSVRRIVRAEFIAGTISIPEDTLCNGQPSQQITGTMPTGGQPTPANTYQWQIFTNTNPVWTNILGGTTLNLQTGSLTGGDYSYRRIDTNPGCGSLDTTNTVAIHVWNPFIAGIPTGGGNFCYGVTGTTTTCTASTGGDSATTTQEIQTSTDGNTWTNTGITALSYTPAGVLTSDIYIRWEFRGNCDTLYSNVIQYHVYPQFVPGTASTTTISPVCNGANGGIAIATPATGGNTAGTTVEWESSIDGITFTNTGNFSLAYSFGTMTVPTWVRIRYMNLCDTAWSNILPIDVYAVLASGGVPTIVGTDTTCLNTDPGSIDAPAATGGNNVFTYQWQSRYNNGTWTNILNATLEDYDIPSLTLSGLYEYQRIATTSCGTITSPSVAVYVYPEFNAGIVGNHAETCNGTAQAPIIEMTPATGGSGSYTYQWIESTDNEASWHNAPGASNGIGYSPATITTTVDIINYYRRIVTDANGCGSAPSTAPALP